MNLSSTVVGHLAGGLLSCACLVVAAIVLAVSSRAANAQAQHSSAQASQPARLSAQEIAEFKAKAESGDAAAQFKLGMAYRKGDEVPKNEELAYKWVRKAADQGNPDAENLLRTMSRVGEGVAQNKEEAVRWYRKAASHGNADGMFNLGTCYYNGEGIGSNEYTAYAWFLVAEQAGSPVAADAVKRSAATMRKRETADVFVQIGEMYDKGEELPQNESRALAWLRKAAVDSPEGKVRLAVLLLKGPEGKLHYSEAAELCKAAAGDYAAAQRILGYFYRTGRGVPRDASEAVKWYKKAAEGNDGIALSELGGMYESGEGTKLDRAEAFIAYFRAWRLGVQGSSKKALSLWREMGKEDQNKTAKKLRSQHFDPEKAIAALEGQPPS